MNKKQKERISTVLFMLGITFVIISALSFVYLFTRDRIRLNESLVLKRAVLYAAGVKTPKNPQDLNDIFNKSVETVGGNGERVKYYIVTDSSFKEKRYVFIENGTGLWGKITAVVGLEGDLKTLSGLDFISQNETPGLGARIDESWFKEQFRGKLGGGITTVPEKEPAGKNQFQAITGATITSNGVRDIIRNTENEAENLIKRGR